MKKVILISFFLLFIAKKISFAQFSDEFQKIIETENCRTLIDSVKQNWTFNKKKNYYQNNFTFSAPDPLVLKQINLPCIKGIKKDDIEILLGKPHKKIGDNLWIYYTHPTIQNGFAESYVYIQFNTYQRVYYISEMNQKGTFDFPDARIDDSIRIKYIKKNWRQFWNYDDSLKHYNTQFNPGTIELLEKIYQNSDTNKIYKTFGKPPEVINTTEWQYHFHNYYKNGKYEGEGIKLIFINGKLSKIHWIYSPVYIDKTECY